MHILFLSSHRLYFMCLSKDLADLQYWEISSLFKLSFSGKVMKNLCSLHPPVAVELSGFKPLF